MNFAVPANHRIKLKENEKKYKYLVLASELKKLWNIKVTIISLVIGALGIYQRIIKWTGGLASWRTSGDHPNYYIIENGQNIEKSLGDSRERPSANSDLKNSQSK